MVLAALALFAGGAVKGLVGIGIPLVSISLLSLFLPLPDAVTLLSVPMIVANVWMSFAGNHFLPTLRRFWPLVLAMFAGTAVGANVLAALDLAALNLLVGIFVVVFCLSSHVNPALRLPDRYEVGAGMVAGGIGGFMGGLSALFGPPLIMYLTSLRLDRDTFVGVISSIYLCCSITLVIALGSVGVMSRAELAESVIACVPLLLGVWIGRRFRSRVDEALFRKLLLVALLGVGVRLIAIALT